MSETPRKFAYRCLPLNIANSYGWQILNPTPFVVNWSGGVEKGAVHILRLKPEADCRPLNVSSHFGNGIFTFAVDGLFRTDPGFDLWVGGPINEFKDGAQPMTGIVETDWSPFTFTMNWKLMRENNPVVFDEDEPFCTIFPLPRGLLETVEPEFRQLSDDSELKKQYQSWAESRNKFNLDLEVVGSAAQKVGWQKDYFRGNTLSGATFHGHRTQLKLRQFAGRLLD
jgi:hypothetical protein